MPETSMPVHHLTELLEAAARCWRDKPALIEGTSVESFGGLLEQVCALADRLRKFQLSPGCRVGLCYPNSINYVVMTFALWRIQAAVVPIPVEYTQEEVEALAQTMQLEAVLGRPTLGQAIELLPGCAFAMLTPASRADNHGLNVAFIRFTSGTTSSRKGVVLTHETVHRRVLTANQAFQIRADDVVMWCLPMSHHFLITILLYISQGATTVLNKFVLPTAFLEEAIRLRATVFYATPFHYALLAAAGPGPKLNSLRLAVSTTCALSQDVALRFEERFRVPLVQALGIIELGLVSLNTDDPRQRWDSVGRPLAAHQVRILDPDETGCGEISIRGPGFLDAYAAPWMARETILDNGWFQTGDIGRLDDDGFLYLVGRTTAVINCAGRKVFPEEIEAILNRHPAVRESRVYGRPHAHLGEVIEADLVLAQPNADWTAVRDFCRTQLAAYKIPTRFHVVADLPRTAVTGKILRALATA